MAPTTTIELEVVSMACSISEVDHHVESPGLPHVRDDGLRSLVAAFERNAINAFKRNADLMGRIAAAGVAWGSVKAFFLDNLPGSLEDRDSIAYNLVRKALNEILGPQNEAWHTFRNPERNNTTYVRGGKHPAR